MLLSCDQPVGDSLVDDKEDTTTRAKTENLGGISLPQGAVAFVLEDLKDGRNGPRSGLVRVLETLHEYNIQERSVDKLSGVKRRHQRGGIVSAQWDQFSPQSTSR